RSTGRIGCRQGRGAADGKSKGWITSGGRSRRNGRDGRQRIRCWINNEAERIGESVRARSGMRVQGVDESGAWFSDERGCNGGGHGGCADIGRWNGLTV